VHHRSAGTAGDPAKAIGFSLRAGQAARELFAWDEAAAHWTGAVVVMARTGGREPERARLLVALADLMVVVGDLPRQIDCLEQALALYERLGDDERAAHAHSRLGMAHSLIDSIDAEHLDLPRAFAHFDAARRVLDQGPVRKARGHLETGVSTALSYGLRMQPGIEAASRAMDVADAVGDELLWAGGAEAYGWHKIVAGELREGFDVVERAFAVADRRQRSFLAWMGANIRGQLTWGLGAPDEAQAFFERPLTLPYVGTTAYRQQIADGIGRCHVSRGELGEARRLLTDAKAAWVTHALEPLVDLWDGRWDEVAALARRALETSRRTGNRWDEFASLHLLARVHHLREEPVPAAAQLQDALRFVVDGGARYFELWVRPDLARVCADLDRLDEARRHVDRCREIVSWGEDWRGRAGHVALAHAVVLARDDRPDEANAAFASAHDTLERHALRGDVADGLHQWGRALARAGDRAGAIEKLEHALEAHLQSGAGGAWHERVGADLRRLRSAGRGALRAS
jgi:tetratricopeptide (TPR) repeat protein